MGKESSERPNYEVLAFVTLKKERILGGKQLTLLAQDEEEQKFIVQDIAKAMKADVVKMKNGDYLVIRV
ncbi:capping complex subunit for YIEGIA [Lysinibacillus capsici]|uniref:capping complex subunit for YIEGIA n=1 Tax=Lysinibacillus capsici TaxID=2115968 RepID=UPI0034E3CF86